MSLWMLIAIVAAIVMMSCPTQFAKATGKAGAKDDDEGESERDAQLAQWKEEVAGVLEEKIAPLRAKVEGLAGLDPKDAKDLRAKLDDVLKASDKIAKENENWRAELDHYRQTGRLSDAQRSMFPSEKRAAAFGKFCLAAYRGDKAEAEAAAKDLQTASASPISGPGGGYLIPAETARGVLTFLPNYGLAPRVLRMQPAVSPMGEAIIDSTDWDVVHPDIDTAPSEQDPTFARVNWSLIVWATLHKVPNDLIADVQANPAVLGSFFGEWIAGKIVRAHARGLDRRFLVGNGTVAMGKVTGVFNRNGANQLRVVGDATHTTFQKLIDETVYYIGKVLGALPEWAAAFDPSWIMHQDVYFGYWGARDTNKMPITNVLLAESGTVRFMLGGYPVNLSSLCPKRSDTAVSKVMAAFGAWSEAWLWKRHISGLEIASSRDAYFTSRQTAFLSAVRQSLDELAPDGYVQLVTAAA